jgi:hypothetical protein
MCEKTQIAAVINPEIPKAVEGRINMDAHDEQDKMV